MARRPIEKVLVANRGEIALRVARTCREIGLRVVAVYSTEDADSPLVELADEAVCIGPGGSHRTYTNVAALVEAAQRTGADAVHPGYGFLSEDPIFSEVCADHNLTFVGPPPAVMTLLGEKNAARAAMARAGLPVLPGTDLTTSPAEAHRAAQEIGYPLVIKPVAGGGGRGITRVDRPQDLDDHLSGARRTANLLFEDDRVYLERFLPAARHVEVQILADDYGGVVHLGDRDCTVQRRNQKLIEEAPASGLPPGVSEQLRAAAVDGGRAAGYSGVGTFEFLVDPHDGYFAFLEVNCRIQVEHPVTEAVTGLDLVEHQLRVAAGEPLPFTQEEIRIEGAAIECRINAEDPDRGFAPAPGKLDVLRLPGGPGVRIDSGICAGHRISPAYDSLVAKVITSARDRDRAIQRMSRALSELRIAGPGIHTTTSLLAEVLASAEFGAATHTTTTVDRLLEARISPVSEGGSR